MPFNLVEDISPNPEVLNPLVSNAPFLYPLNISENLTVFRYVQGIDKGCIGNKWVNVNKTFYQHGIVEKQK